MRFFFINLTIVYHLKVSTAILHSRTVVFKYYGFQNLKATYFKTDFIFIKIKNYAGSLNSVGNNLGRPTEIEPILKLK
jgi:hypothetical protein